jgi:hypothetical protein
MNTVTISADGKHCRLRAQRKVAHALVLEVIKIQCFDGYMVSSPLLTSTQKALELGSRFRV